MSHIEETRLIPLTRAQLDASPWFYLWETSGPACTNPWLDKCPTCHTSHWYLDPCAESRYVERRWTIYVSERTGEMLPAGFAGEDDVCEVEVAPVHRG